MRQRESAICVRATDYSETSQIVHFITRTSGLVRLIAKGSKRPKSKSGGAIDLLSEGDLVYSSGAREALGTLMEFTETVSHVGLRRSGRRLNTALYMIEVVGDMLAEADPHVEVFDLLHNALARLGQADSPAPAVLAYFQWRLLLHVGLQGEMDKCVSCGRATIGETNLHFSSQHGGMLCGACEGAAPEKYRLDAETLVGLAALRAAQSGQKVPLPDAQADRVNRLLCYHIQQQLGRRLKMARHALP